MGPYYIRTALQQMARYPLQSLLVVAGVAIGIANVIALMSMTDMARRQTMGLLEQFGARVLIITPYVDFSSSPTWVFSQANTSGFIPQEVYDVLAQSEVMEPQPEAPQRLQVSAMLTFGSHASHGGQSMSTVIAGASQQVQQFGGFELERGRWVSLEDEQQGRRVAVLGKAARLELFGERDPLGESIEIKQEQFEVVGHLRHKPANSFEDNDSRIFIPLSTAQELTGVSGMHGIIARYRQGVSEDEAIAAVRAELAAAGLSESGSEVVSIFTVHEATKLMDRTLGIFRTVLLGVASIALIVAGIGIMNVMLIRVLRRRAEIGLRRAVGATLRSIVSQFVVESLVQALLGAVVGVIVGASGLMLFTSYSEWQFYISPRTLLIAIAFGLLVGILFGAYPARTAARVDPIKSLRVEQ